MQLYCTLATVQLITHGICTVHSVQYTVKCNLFIYLFIYLFKYYASEHD